MNEQRLNTSDDNEISNTYDVFIKEVEKKLGYPFKLIKGEVPLAPKEHYKENFPYKVIGQATCYAAIDKQIIEIKDTCEIMP